MTVDATAEDKLRSAIRDAGFAVMETSGKWSIHCVTDAAKQAEEVEGRLIAENIDLAEWKADQQQALIKMSIACLNAGFKGDSVVEGVKWMEVQVKTLREGLEASLAKFNESDEERLKETEERYAEAEKWRKEGDMCGWNFHQGVAGGCTQVSIIFFRVKRCIENALAK